MEWNWIKKSQRKYMGIPRWMDQGVVCAFTTRNGGQGGAPFATLNLGLHVGDHISTVIDNRKLVADDLDISLDSMVCAQQVHGNLVASVGEHDKGRGVRDYNDSLPGFDGMVTNRPGVFLMEFYADCIPLYFFDPVRRVVGLAHSGWKGTVMGIASATVQVMHKQYGSRICDIEAFIGPGIGPECYLIDDTRRAEVEQVFTFADEIIYPIEKQAYEWDLHLTNQKIIRSLGLEETHILSCGLCTACHKDQFFSYRAEQGKTGRMAAILGLRD